ncbi:MAG: TIR domain-containing protein [Acidobacteria bacterium]|nr:TIR domain-containing protein [Acidobacteriota bacterium]
MVRIFMSHHASAKPLVREVREHLPRHVNAWVDEHELLVGQDLAESIREAIQCDSDFLVLFLDQKAKESSWVQTELEWALEEEKRIGRPFILPILFDDAIEPEFSWVRDRLHLKCHGYGESDVRHVTDELASALFAWLSRDLDALRSDPVDSDGRLDLANRADMLLEEAAGSIRRLVFPYRRDHPLKLKELLAQLQDETELSIESLDDLDTLLFRLRERRMISGIALTGTTIFVGEEHLNWRSQEAIEAKKAAAEYVVGQLRDGETIYLDAGSSTLEVCRGILREIRFGRWTNLRLFTNSVPIAAEVSEFANELGLEDNDPRLRVIVVGGEMRLNTSALVDCPEEMTLEWESAAFDTAVIGTNGVSWEYGCTTTEPGEAHGKRQALLVSERRFVMAEPSKYGVWQSEHFASFEDHLTIVTAVREPDDRVTKLQGQIAGSGSEIVTVEIA